MKVRVLKSINKNTPSVKAYTKAIKEGQHVVPSVDGWKVKKANSERATKKFDTQKQAISFAMEVAKNQKTELLIHGKDGKIRNKNSYGEDSFPPRG